MGTYADSRNGNRLSDLSDNELPGRFVFGAGCTASVGSGHQLCGLHCNSGGNMEGAGTTGNRGGTDQRGGIEGGLITDKIRVTGKQIILLRAVSFLTALNCI